MVGHATGASPSREAVIRALDNCYDPCCQDRKISVVDMGLIESIDIDARRVRIEMVLTTGWCPFASRLLEMVEEEVGGPAYGGRCRREGRLGPDVDAGEDEQAGSPEADDAAREARAAARGAFA